MTTEQAATFSSRQAIAKGNRCPSHKASGRDKSIKRREFEEISELIDMPETWDIICYAVTNEDDSSKDFDIETILTQARASEREQWQKELNEILDKLQIEVNSHLEDPKFNKCKPLNRGAVYGWDEMLSRLREDLIKAGLLLKSSDSPKPKGGFGIDVIRRLK